MSFNKCFLFSISFSSQLIRRMETETKAKEEYDEFILLFKIVQGKTASVARNWTKFSPKQTWRPLPLLLSPSFFYGARQWTEDTISQNVCYCISLSFAMIQKRQKTKASNYRLLEAFIMDYSKNPIKKWGCGIRMRHFIFIVSTHRVKIFKMKSHLKYFYFKHFSPGARTKLLLVWE